MTTVLDPSGTPIPIYNNSGTTISFISGNGTGQGSGTVIDTPSFVTVIVIACTGSNYAATLPAGVDIGSIVEAYATGDHAANVFPPSGSSIGARPTNSEVVVSVDYGRRFRKVSATSWQVLGSQ